jgi:hypothetical protein
MDQEKLREALTAIGISPEMNFEWVLTSVGAIVRITDMPDLPVFVIFLDGNATAVDGPMKDLILALVNLLVQGVQTPLNTRMVRQILDGTSIN